MTDIPESDRVEEVQDESEEEVNDTPASSSSADASKQSKGEKKVRKQIEKLGLIHVPDISRVTMKRAKMLFLINKPDVYKSPTADTYVIFGECKIADTSKGFPTGPSSYAAPEAAKKPTVTAPSVAATTTSDEAVDETGVEAKDIELVMGQAGCSRAAAVKALKANDNDIVNAIMELTM